MTSESTRIAALSLAASLLIACAGGGGGSGDSERTSVPPPETNNPPTISGTPALSITYGQNYEFAPTASDPDDDALTFSIANQPDWTVFDSTTGALTGTPGEADIGVTTDVTISVSDGALSASLGPFDLEVLRVVLGSATVSWNIPTKNADGSPMSDLAGFRIHYGTVSQDYVEVIEVIDAMASSVLIEDLEPATYFFAVTAVDLVGNESAFSAEASKAVQP